MKYVCIVILACLFASCSPLIQKAYFIESPNVGAFDSAKVTNICISGQYASSSNVQISHSFSNTLGISGSAHFGYQKPVGNSIDNTDFPDKPGKPSSVGANASLIYFKKFQQKYFEISTGYGFQFNNNRKYGGWLIPVSFVGGPWLSHDVHSLYHRLSVQPAFMLFWGNHKFGIAFRTDIVYCPYYFYNYELDIYNPETSYMISDEYSDKISFYNKFFGVVSPFILYRFSHKGIGIGMHLGFAWHSNVINHRNETQYLNPDIVNYIIDKQPTMANVVFGLDMCFSWKNKR